MKNAFSLAYLISVYILFVITLYLYKSLYPKALALELFLFGLTLLTLLIGRLTLNNKQETLRDRFCLLLNLAALGLVVYISPVVAVKPQILMKPQILLKPPSLYLIALIAGYIMMIALWQPNKKSIQKTA